jgi:hypothetical protein
LLSRPADCCARLLGKTAPVGVRGGDAGPAIDVRADTGTAASPTLAVRFANTVIDRWPNPTTITGVTRGWDYNNGIVLRGMATPATGSSHPAARC